MLDFFDRVENGRNVKIEVESDIERYHGNKWLLSIFLDFDSFETHTKEYMNFLQLKGSLIIQLEDEDKTGYVGSRSIDGWTEFYFYSKNNADLKSRMADVFQYTEYNYESYVAKDSDWSFYHRKLEPNEDEVAIMEQVKQIAKDYK